MSGSGWQGHIRVTTHARFFLVGFGSRRCGLASLVPCLVAAHVSNGQQEVCMDFSRWSHATFTTCAVAILFGAGGVCGPARLSPAFLLGMAAGQVPAAASMMGLPWGSPATVLQYGSRTAKALLGALPPQTSPTWHHRMILLHSLPLSPLQRTSRYCCTHHPLEQ